MSKEYKPIRIEAKGHQIIEKAAKKYECSMGEVAAQSVQFCLTNRFNPFDTDEKEKKAVLDEMRKWKNDTIGFLREQEKSLIKPTGVAINSLNTTVGELIMAVKTLNETVTPGETSAPEEAQEQEIAPKATPNPLQRIVDRKEKQLGRNFELMNELKGSFVERKGQYFINLPKGRVDDILSEFFNG